MDILLCTFKYFEVTKVVDELKYSFLSNLDKGNYDLDAFKLVIIIFIVVLFFKIK
jgi:hypothetical protein